MNWRIEIEKKKERKCETMRQMRVWQFVNLLWENEQESERERERKERRFIQHWNGLQFEHWIWSEFICDCQWNTDQNKTKYNGKWFSNQTTFYLKNRLNVSEKMENFIEWNVKKNIYRTRPPTGFEKYLSFRKRERERDFVWRFLPPFRRQPWWRFSR